MTRNNFNPRPRITILVFTMIVRRRRIRLIVTQEVTMTVTVRTINPTRIITTNAITHVVMFGLELEPGCSKPDNVARTLMHSGFRLCAFRIPGQATILRVLVVVWL